MASPFINNKKDNKTASNIVIFTVFLLPTVVALYSMLFGGTYTAEQSSALFWLFLLGLTWLFINNMPEL